MVACSPGTEPDPDTGGCIATCLEGTHRDIESGACILDGADCVSGQIMDPVTGTCIDAATVCAEGSTWVAGEKSCVPDERLRTPDQQESAHENDPQWGSSQSVEYFELPGTGGTWTLGGTVDVPTDKDGDGTLEPDYDVWLFEADEPVVLRLAADAYGGASSGFQIIELSGTGYTRLAVGTTSTSVTRDVFVPRPGYYALVATDALNLIMDGVGPYHGGPDFAYFIEVSVLPVPEPIPLQLSDGLAVREGEWPGVPPQTGSSLGFFSLHVEPHEIYDFGIAQLEPGIVPELQVLGSGFTATVGGGKITTHGFAAAEEVLLVADYFFSTVNASARYKVVGAQRPSTWIDEVMTPVIVEQPLWTFEALETPSRYHGFQGAETDVVTVSATSSTGQTCLEVFDAHFQGRLALAGCQYGPTVSPLFEAELRFQPPYSGYYALTAFDILDYVTDPGGRLAIVPEHSYELGVRIRRQTPVNAGLITVPWSATGATVDADRPEAFFAMRPLKGDAVQGRVTGLADPTITLYEDHPGQLEAASASGGHFVLRSLGTRVLLGVSEAAGDAGTFDLELAPLELDVLGPATADAPLQGVATLAAGESNRYVQVRTEEAGLVELQVLPPDGLDVALVPRDPSLAPAGERVDLIAGAGPEVLIGAAGSEGLFLEIVTADGQPVAAEKAVVIQGTFSPAQAEVEPNDSPLQAQDLQLPAAISAGIQAPGEPDWYRVVLTEPATLFAATLPTGAHPIGDTVIMLADGNGQQVLLDDDGGVGAYSRVELPLEAGTWFVAVGGFGSLEGDYLLEVGLRP